MNALVTPPRHTGARNRVSGRLGGWLVLCTGLGVALAVLLAALAFARYERGEVLEAARERGELLARVLEAHVTRSIDAADVVLTALAESLTLQAETQNGLWQPMLEHALVGQPYLRSVALLDADGRVLASSQATETGLRLSRSALGRLPPVGTQRLLTLQPGRGLADLSEQADAVPRRAARGVYVLPMVRSLRVGRGRELLLLALINPEALANFQQTALADVPGAALLGSFAGQLLAGTEALSLEPGASLAEHPVYREWLPSREHGSYSGIGALPGTQLVSFRVSRTRPLVLVVEQEQARLLAPWRQSMQGLAIATLLALLLIAAATAVLWRSLLARERARRALDLAHAQVAQRERELSVLLKSVQELIFRTDAQGAISFVNARWAALSSERVEQALGQHLADLVLPAERAQVAALFSLDDQVGVRQLEASLRSGAGGTRRFDIAVVPLRVGEQIVGFAGSAVDVTERYVARQSLQRQLAFTGLLLEISPLPVSVVDAKGCYVSVNQAWESFTGRTRDEVVGRPVGYAMPAHERAVHEQQDARLRAEGGTLHCETQLRHHDGSLRDILITKVLILDEQGGHAGVLSTLMDVSEFRDAERATREARDVAEQASRAKSEFIANISHELRTPLQSILGFSELGMTRGREHARLAAMFTDIHDSGQRMLALVNDLLDVAKIESSVGTFELERCDLRELARAAMRELSLLMERKQQQLILTLPEQPLLARLDPRRFQQVLRNVLANANKFSPEGSCIELLAALQAGEQGPEIHLSIADRGPGIPPAELDQIFEAFVQSSQTKDGSGGTGLGLAICRKIVEIHGGRISAENRAGGGAVFHICVPSKSGGDTQLMTQL